METIACVVVIIYMSTLSISYLLRTYHPKYSPPPSQEPAYLNELNTVGHAEKGLPDELEVVPAGRGVYPSLVRSRSPVAVSWFCLYMCLCLELPINSSSQAPQYSPSRMEAVTCVLFVYYLFQAAGEGAA